MKNEYADEIVKFIQENNLSTFSKDTLFENLYMDEPNDIKGNKISNGVKFLISGKILKEYYLEDYYRGRVAHYEVDINNLKKLIEFE